jgi:predicted nucleic acid-binding protein
MLMVLGLLAGEPLSGRPLVEPALQLTHEIGRPLYDCLYLAAAESIDGKVLTADVRFLDRVRRTPLTDRIRGLEELD